MSGDFFGTAVAEQQAVIAISLIMLIASLAAPPAAQPTPTAPAKAPPVADVQVRAVEFARLDPAEISTWKKRAKLAPLLPRLEVRYDNHIKDYVNVDVTDSVYVGSSGTTVGPPEGKYNANRNNENDIGVRAIWNLKDAVFNRDMLAVSVEARSLARDRNLLLAEVNKNYFDRDRAAAEISFLSEELKKKPGDAKIRQRIFLCRVAIDEATAALDAMTGGWFGRQLGRD